MIFVLADYGNFLINVQICSKKERLHVLLSLLEKDAPKSGIIFVAEQVLLLVDSIYSMAC